ncbi:MAG: glycosyltransferase family 9 protein [Alphaproteobacteria bacterium]|nr:glycosyltransferase family 9 protein [Alphaproteobacteria bacterium]
MSSSLNNVLVIKLSALGDFVQALAPFAAIREHHKDTHITLLTTKIYADFAKNSPYFDEVLIDNRPKIWQILDVLKLRKKLLSGNFQVVYDLQTSNRSSWYFNLMSFFSKTPKWSGIAKGCTYLHDNPKRNFMHTIERQAEQLKIAGINQTKTPDLSWVESDISRFNLPEKYALFIAGGAMHRPEKRWSATKFAELGQRLLKKSITPVILGTTSEKKVIDVIMENCPKAISLAGKTSISDIAVLAKNAVAAVGNDTGPMHMIAAANCHSVVLYSKASNPDLCGQRGGNVTIIQKNSFKELDVNEVEKSLIVL